MLLNVAKFKIVDKQPSNEKVGSHRRSRPGGFCVSLRWLLGVWIVTTLAALHSLRSVAAAATFYNSVSSVFEIEATVRTEGRRGEEEGGREERGRCG